MKVRDIMTRNIASVNPLATVAEAARLMEEYNVGSIPVCDKNGLIGIVTDRDIVMRNVARGKNPENTSIKEVMSAGVTTVTPDTEIAEVAKVMGNKRIRRLPVVENNKLVGMLALGDVAVHARRDMEIAGMLAIIFKTNKYED